MSARYCHNLTCYQHAKETPGCDAHKLQGWAMLESFQKRDTPNRLRWNLNASEIASLTDALIVWGREEYDKCAAAVGNPTYENTVKVLSEADAFVDVVSSCLTFPKDSNPDKDIREAAVAASKLLSKFNVECSMRYDVYLAVKAFAEVSTLTGEDDRLLKRILRDYRRVGMHLDKDTRAQLKSIEERMSECSTSYAQNSNEESASFEFSAADLAGVPEDYLAAREKKDQDGKAVEPKVYVVTLKYPDFNPINTLCQVAATRKAMEFAFNTRNVPENVVLLEELVSLRQKHAELLGFKTHAHFMLDARMAKTPEAVVPFLEDLNVKLTPLWEKEREVLRRYKKETEGDDQLHAWDMGFYTNIVQQRDYQVDHEALKPYFPLDHVTKELLAIYQELLGLLFVEVKDTKAWHPDVRLFEVYNQGEEKAQEGNGPLIGMFYLDMHPRIGKYGHAAVFGLQPGCEIQGVRQVPVCAGMMNFSEATPSKPSLLKHDEVVTFFHEFGHAMHQMCALAKHAMFAGTAVERDFVEAPSQMLENWCWCEEGLARLSKHFETGEQLPPELIKALVASKTAGAGYSNKRQLVFGLFDQAIHATGKADTAEVFRQVQAKVFPDLPVTPGTNKAGSFGHLAGGYHAQYYGYMWSDVFSADMFQSEFKQHGIFSTKIGDKYRRCILQPGGSRDAADMLRDFLGRDPVPEPFLESLGLTV